MYSIGLNFLYFSRKCTGNSALYYTFPGQGNFTFHLVELVMIEGPQDDTQLLYEWGLNQLQQAWYDAIRSITDVTD